MILNPLSIHPSVIHFFLVRLLWVCFSVDYLCFSLFPCHCLCFCFNFCPLLIFIWSYSLCLPLQSSFCFPVCPLSSYFLFSLVFWIYFLYIICCCYLWVKWWWEYFVTLNKVGGFTSWILSLLTVCSWTMYILHDFNIFSYYHVLVCLIPLSPFNILFPLVCVWQPLLTYSLLNFLLHSLLNFSSIISFFLIVLWICFLGFLCSCPPFSLCFVSCTSAFCLCSSVLSVFYVLVLILKWWSFVTCLAIFMRIVHLTKRLSCPWCEVCGLLLPLHWFSWRWMKRFIPLTVFFREWLPIAKLWWSGLGAVTDSVTLWHGRL